MTSTTQQLLDSARAALGTGDWATARSLLTDALEQDESAEALHLLASAMEWAGEYESSIGLYERAFLAYRQLGECRLPALIAGRELAFLHAAVFGNEAVAAGWLERAWHLADEAGDCIERGWVELAEMATTDDPDVMDVHIQSATDIARRFGDTDLHFCALGYRALSLVLRGQIADGMRKVDEAVTAAANGEVRDYLTIGEIYCKMLLCCELTLDVRRADQWLAEVESFDTRTNAPWVSAICRTHYGGILTAAGRWTDAEQELAESVRLYDLSYRALRSSALVRLADLRVRQGRYDEAARLLAGFEFDSYAVRPLARLHLVRGEFDLARRILRRSLGSADHPLRAPELALLAEVEVAAGQIVDARDACRRLDAIAVATQEPRIRALAEYAAGITGAADSDPTALTHLEAALPAFVTSGLPLEEARTRLQISRQLADTTPSVAVAEAQAALKIFDHLAAQPDADAAAQHLRGLGTASRAAPRRAGPLTARETEVIGLVAEGLSNEHIAKRLFISKRTVEHHIGNILGKLGLNTRAEAIAYLHRHGTP